MPFVLDASVALSWAFEDESSAFADRVLSILDSEPAIVPPIWPMEIANALIMAERRGRSDLAASNRFVMLVASLPIEVESPPRGLGLEEILNLSRELRISSYDASYLELAIRKGIKLASEDRRLVQAATQIGVSLR